MGADKAVIIFYSFRPDANTEFPTSASDINSENYVKHIVAEINRDDGKGKKPKHSVWLRQASRKRGNPTVPGSVITSQKEMHPMATLNKVVIVGHLVREPEKRVGLSGNPFIDFTIAANCRYKDKNGHPQEKTASIPCLVFATAVAWLFEKKKGILTIMSGRERNDRRHSRRAQRHQRGSQQQPVLSRPL